MTAESYAKPVEYIATATFDLETDLPIRHKDRNHDDALQSPAST